MTQTSHAAWRLRNGGGGRRSLPRHHPHLTSLSAARTQTQASPMMLRILASRRKKEKGVSVNRRRVRFQGCFPPTYGNGELQNFTFPQET